MQLDDVTQTECTQKLACGMESKFYMIIERILYLDHSIGCVSLFGSKESKFGIRHHNS